MALPSRTRPDETKPDAGLCSACRHALTQRSPRGQTFWRCGRSASDPAYPRYPPLPVLECRGFERRRRG